VGDGRWLSREQIETSGVLEGRGLEIAWVDDAVELFFLQIQGSGRIKLTGWISDPRRIWRTQRA
jgi:membrane-bound lytic murein transglycosylase A